MIAAGDVKTIHHNLGAGYFFPHGFCKTLVHITTHRLDGLDQAVRDRTQKSDHRIFLAISQAPPK